MKRINVITFFLGLILLNGCVSPPPLQKAKVTTSQDIKPILNETRNAAVEITSVSGNSKGTGFFIAPETIVSCFHVIANPSASSNGIALNVFQDLKVKTSQGEVLDAVVVSVPNQNDITPLPPPFGYDFAVLHLTQKPAKPITLLPIVSDANTIEVGDDIIFSGYPLATPAMVTHKGMISGISTNGEIICIEASINKGNSDGALCNSSGQVIGIISMREGGISYGLKGMADYIDQTSKNGSVRLMGVDPLQDMRALTLTLDEYISTGIGYARSVQYLRAYLKQHSEMVK
jgi:S1-C subfamily serine protease